MRKTPSAPTVQKPYWIIRNNKKGVIWKQPYYSQHEAEQELAEQMKLYPKATGWFIEKNFYWGEKDGLDDFN